MAEWLRPRASLLRTDYIYAGYAWDQNPVPSRKSIGWAVGEKKHVMAGVSRHFLFCGQDGRVVKASFSERCSC